MPIVKKMRGTGITEHELTVIRGPFGQKEREAFALMFQNEPFDSVIDGWARAILTQAGVPGTKWAKLNADGTITGDLPDGWEKDPRAMLGADFVKAGNTLGLVVDGFGVDSLEGYAARALGKLDIIRAALDRAPKEAAEYSFELGLLMQECFMKFRHEANAQTGAKIRPQLIERRDRANATRRRESTLHHNKLRQERDKIIKNAPHLTKSAVALVVINRTKTALSFHHVRKILRT